MGRGRISLQGAAIRPVKDKHVWKQHDGHQRMSCGCTYGDIFLFKFVLVNVKMRTVKLTCLE